MENVAKCMKNAICRKVVCFTFDYRTPGRLPHTGMDVAGGFDEFDEESEG
jgi:hypothetical protein